MERVFDFFKISWLNFKGQHTAFNFEEFITLKVAYPFITLLFHCVLATYAYGKIDIVKWVIGNSFLLCNSTCLFSLGTCFVAERYFGRIRSIVTGSKSKIQIIFEKGFFSTLVGIITTLVGFILGCVVFDLNLNNFPWLFFGATLFSSMMAFTGFAMFLSVFGLISDSQNLILNLVEYILLIFTGANIPVDKLEYPLKLISELLPMTRGIIAMDLYIKEERGLLCYKLLGQELLVGIVYFLLASLIIQLAENKAIKDGTLDLF